MKNDDVNKSEELIAIARAILDKMSPYFAPTYEALIPVQLPGLNTMGVTAGLVLYYDPAWLATCAPMEVAGALRHESRHHIHEHPERMTFLEDKDKANIAADMSFNPDERAAGWPLPENKGVYPEDFGFDEGLLAEEYYELLTKPQPKKKGGGTKGGKNPDGEKSGGGSGNDPQAGNQPGTGSGKEPHQHGPGCGHGGCGGIAGNPRDFEKALDEQYGRPEIEKDVIKKATAQEIQKYVEQHGRGSVPGGLLEDMENILKPAKISWRRKLGHVVKKCTGRLESGGMDFSLARPSKRSYSREILRPGMVQYQPEVCLILDTSGSMGTQQMQDSIIESISLLKSTGIDMAWFIQADTQVATPPTRVRLRDLMKNIQIHGRGGTDFDDALQRAEKLKPRPDIIIYFTDGDGAAQHKPRGIEVIWCVVPSYYNRKPNANFGHVVIIEQEGKKMA
jgi:predicted metal-dependent peptidase